MRPEAGGNAWNAHGSEIPDDWEPWRPGDPGTLDHPEGVPVERREGLLGGEKLSVQFENGYRLDNIQPVDVERRGWLD